MSEQEKSRASQANVSSEAGANSLDVSLERTAKILDIMGKAKVLFGSIGTGSTIGIGCACCAKGALACTCAACPIALGVTAGSAVVVVGLVRYWGKLGANNSGK